MWIVPTVLIPDGLSLEEYTEAKELLCSMHIPETIFTQEGSDVKQSENKER